MYKFRLILGLALTTYTLSAIEVGSTYDEVIAAKGTPPNKMELNDTQVLNYADTTIKLREGKVVSIKVVKPGEATANVFHARPPPVTASWSTDYAASLARAKTEKRKVVLVFTGSDWSEPSKRLDKEILSTREFGSFARDNALLVKLDYPHTGTQTLKLKEQNKKLGEMYKVTDYPTVIVLNSEGEIENTIGFDEGGPAPFIKKLKGEKTN